MSARKTNERRAASKKANQATAAIADAPAKAAEAPALRLSEIGPQVSLNATRAGR
jgi:hypothetical protein